MADRNGYIGRAPGDSSVVIARQIYAPTRIQTDFTFDSTYTPGYLDVYLNGVRLVYPTDYSASDGSTVGLTTNAISGDTLELVAYKSFNVGSVEEAAGNFSVGGNATITGSLTVTGDTTLAAGSSVSFATTSFGLSGSPDVTVPPAEILPPTNKLLPIPTPPDTINAPVVVFVAAVVSVFDQTPDSKLNAVVA